MGVSANITLHARSVRRIPERASGADTGDTQPSSAQAGTVQRRPGGHRAPGDLRAHTFPIPVDALVSVSMIFFLLSNKTVLFLNTNRFFVT